MHFTLESIDEKFMRKVLSAHSKTPIEMLYLENGYIPVQFIIMTRRLNFLWYILQQDPKSLLFQFFNAQLNNPIKGDWILTVKDDLKALKIDLDFDSIKKLSKTKFKMMVKDRTKATALQYLIKLQGQHSKSQNIEYQNLHLQDYLKSGSNLTIQEKAFIFAARTRMIELNCNFKQGKLDLKCRKCHAFDETQEHLLKCQALCDNSLVTSNPKYHDLFCNDKFKVGTVGRILLAKFKQLKSETDNCNAMCTNVSLCAATDTISVDLD